MLGAPVPAASAAKAISAAQEVIATLAKTGPTAAEFERARGEMLTELSRQGPQESLITATADNWLNSEIYKLPPAADSNQEVSPWRTSSASRADCSKNVPIATIAVGNVEQLKSSLGPAIEVRGAKPEGPAVKTAADPATPAKKP